MRSLTTSSLVRASLASLATLASPVLAPTARAASPEPRRYDHHFSAGDWVGALLAGDAAGAAGGALGGALGHALAGSCIEDPNDDSLFGSCYLHGFEATTIGAAVGSTFGGAAGVYGYGQLTGHSGSYWAAAGGWALGLVASGGVFAAASDESIGVVSLFILPALGATAGYVLTLDDGGPAVAPTGALLEVDHGVRVAVPSVSVSLGADHRPERIDVPLVGGHF